MVKRVKTVQESDLRMLGSLARNIQRVLPVTQADIDAAAALGKGWVVWKVFEVSDPLDNLRGGTQLIIRQNSVQPGQNVRRVIFVSGPGGQTVVIRGTDYIVLPDAIANSLSYVKAFGGTEQNGTPTPDAPIDIVCNNGVLKYGAIGKNLLNLDAPGVIYGDFINDSGTVVHDNTSTISDFIPCTEGAYYTAQNVALAYGSNLRIHGYDENKNWVQMLAKSLASVGVITTATCQIPAGIKYIKVCGYMMGIAGKDAMLELGSTATPYEPYMAGIYTDGTVETISVHGKNLLNPANIHQGTIVSQDGRAALTSNRCYFDFIKVNTGDVVYISAKNNTPPVYNKMFRYSENNENSYRGSTSGQNFTFGEYSGYKINIDFDGYIRGLFLQNAAFTPADVVDAQVVIQNNAPTSYEPYYDGGTATAEMLLKVGDYQDEQEIISGVVTRNVGVKVLDGTENWVDQLSGSRRIILQIPGILNDNTAPLLVTHGKFATTTVGGDNHWRVITGGYVACYTSEPTLADFKAFLADQYAAGTPVIVVYPLATPTTETVAGQTLQVQAGDNTLEITQASLTGLELEAQYNAAVSLTIQEVQDANLDNNVTVTIQ